MNSMNLFSQLHGQQFTPGNCLSSVYPTTCEFSTSVVSCELSSLSTFSKTNMGEKMHCCIVNLSIILRMMKFTGAMMIPNTFSPVQFLELVHKSGVADQYTFTSLVSTKDVKLGKHVCMLYSFGQ